MAGTTPQIDAMIEDFTRRLAAHVQIERVILFGSRAKGTALKESDVDLAVISPDFREMRWVKRLELLWTLWDHTVPGELFGYTPEEFEARKDELGFVGEIHKHGIVVGP